MKFKLDENLGHLGIQLLCQAGHETTTVIEQNLASTSDQNLIKICRQENRCLITLDLDFSNPLRFSPHEYVGIAVLRVPSPITLSSIREAIEILIKGLETESIEGCLWIIQRGRIRIYQQE